MKRLLFTFFTVLISISIAVAGTIQLPQTGQTTCYDSSGTTIVCAGTGQDGDIQAGVVWPNTRFVDNDDQTITDKLTGLIWTKDANLMKTRDPAFDTDINSANNGESANDGSVSWQHALGYAKKVNNESYLGHSDWRLPNFKELESLLNLQISNQSTWLSSQGFNNVLTSSYWSSTSTADANSSTNFALAWSVTMNGGYAAPPPKTINLHVWLVRTGQPAGAILPKTGQTACYDDSGATIFCVGTGQDGETQAGADWPIPRFTANNDQTVTDNLTGITWTKDANLMKTRDPSFDTDKGTNDLANDGRVTWQHALDYVKKLNNDSYLGFSNWRLPNRIELESLMNRGQSNNVSWLALQGFTNTVSGNYRTSTTSAKYLTSAWFVDAGISYVDSTNKTTAYSYVWPVRGGLTGNLTPINGVCGSSNGGIFSIAPTTNLCNSGTPSASGVWAWDCTGQNGGASAHCSAVLGYLLSATLAGTGSGNVNSITPGVTFTCTPGSCPAQPIPYNTTLTLSASPASTAIFNGWTGACTNSTGDCAVTMDAGKNVTATFNTMPPLKIPGVSAKYYNTLALALADTVAIPDNSIVNLYGQSVNFTGGFNLNRPVNIVFEGGFDASFQSNSGGGMSILIGGLTISNGSLAVKNFVLQ